MEKSLNVLVMGKVPIVCSAISNTITRNFRESFAIITSDPFEALQLNEIVSFNLIIIDGDAYSSEELIVMFKIKKIRSKVKIVIILFDESDKTLKWYFKNGAHALLSKYSSEEKIVKTINLSINCHNHFVNDLKIKVTSTKAIKDHQLET
jgi:DNA-binding NarL/FixJ family response regulator